MAAKVINNARFCNLIDSDTNWQDYNPILKKGELGIVTDTIIGQGVGTIGVIGNGSSSIQELLTGYNDNLIYFGRGAHYEMPLAGGKLGGVVNGEFTKTGIRIEKGIVYNGLIDNWNVNENCFTINKLEVKKLLYDEASTSPVFDTDTIQVRYHDPDSVEPPKLLEDYKISGVQTVNIAKDEDGNWIDGYFGLDNKGNFYTLKGDYSYAYYPIMNPLTKNTIGYYNFNFENHAFSLQTPKELVFKNDYWATGSPEDEKYEETKLRIYDGGITNSLEIDITPPKLTLNNSEITYNPETNSYVGNFDGGLTTENAAEIAKIPVLEASFNELKTSTESSIETLNDDLKDLDDRKLESDDIRIEGDGKISIEKTEGTTTFKVVHNNVEQQTINNEEVIIVPNTGIPYTFITGIGVDDQGHITKIITSTYKWN